MRILITGAFGSLGTYVLEQLKDSEHNITCLVSNTPKSKRKASRYRKNFTIIFGDVRDPEIVRVAMKDQELILHFAAIVPPRFNYERLDYSREVNVDSVKNIIAIASKLKKKPKLLYPSSVAVFGDVRDRGACILSSDELTNPNADDVYAQQKVLAEEAVKKSKLKWTIFRFGFMPNVNELKMDPMMFDVPLDTNMEIIHLKDAATSIINALEKKEIWGKIWHIAGGETCRLTYKEFIAEMLGAMGLKPLPDEAFGSNDFHCAFFDTDESQKLLQYQSFSFQDLIAEIKSKTKVLRFFARLFRPIAKIYLLSKSPYYKERKKK